MNAVRRKLTVAYADADPKPAVITLSRKNWWSLFDSYTDTIKDTYAKHGFYKVVANRKPACLHLNKDAKEYVEAYGFMGVPVVVAEDYAQLIKGRRVRWVVLAL